MDQLSSKYYFTHKSGVKIIAQTITEFFHMQGFKSKDVPEYMKNAKGEFDKYPWGGQQVRLGYKEWRNNPGKEQYEAELRSDNFWKKCIGYERLGNNTSKTCRDSRLTFGYFGCPLRSFLRNMANHAVMMGDKEAYDKAHSLQPRGNQLLLTYSS